MNSVASLEVLCLKILCQGIFYFNLIGPLCIYYGFWFCVFRGFLCLHLRSFSCFFFDSFSSTPLSYPDFFDFVLSYLTLLLFL